MRLPQKILSQRKEGWVIGGLEHIVKQAHEIYLERRHQALEDEIGKALLHCSTDDLMIVDLKRRMLQLRDELERLRHEVATGGRLH